MKGGWNSGTTTSTRQNNNLSSAYRLLKRTPSQLCRPSVCEDSSAWYGERFLYRVLSRTILTARHYFKYNFSYDAVSAYLEQELNAERIVWAGSLEQTLRMGIHISPFGVIPKKERSNKWRLTLDLLSPDGSSMNDGIAKEWCTLQYMSVSEVASKVAKYPYGQRWIYSTSIPSGCC